MRVLCCLDGTNIEQVRKAVSTLIRADALTVGLIFVIDTGPRGEVIGPQRERFLRPSQPSLSRREQMQQAEEVAAQDILTEGSDYFTGAELLRYEGRPEREIVQCANVWKADLIVICPRSSSSASPSIGPKSVGHVARFVLDHAPCPVLLLKRREHL